MALKRSAGIGALTLYAALVPCASALAHGSEGGAILGGPDASAGILSLGRVGRDKGVGRTLVARRGFGTTGRNKATSGGE